MNLPRGSMSSVAEATNAVLSVTRGRVLRSPSRGLLTKAALVKKSRGRLVAGGSPQYRRMTR